MMLLALLAATAAVQPDRPATPIAVQANATVRILAGARVSSADEPPAEAMVRETKVRGPDGSESRARLVEFP